jgi:hypothetical protein
VCGAAAQKFSKNPAATSKFQAPEGLNESNVTLNYPQILSTTVQNLVAINTLDSAICAPLVHRDAFVNSSETSVDTHHIPRLHTQNIISFQRSSYRLITWNKIVKSALKTFFIVVTQTN